MRNFRVLYSEHPSFVDLFFGLGRGYMVTRQGEEFNHLRILKREQHEKSEQIR